MCGKSLPRQAPGANVKQQPLHYWLLSLGPLMEAKMAVSSGCLRKLVAGRASLGALEESTSFIVIAIGPAKKEAGLPGSPASTKLEQKTGKQV